jgi:hypothetical protein
MKVTAQGYTQHLITSQVNYTCSYYGDRVEGISGDKIERYLKSAKLTPRMLWDKTIEDIVFSNSGCIIFDDTVIDHNRSTDIEIVRKQWSGNQHKVIRGIGLVGCLYYNPELNRSWLIDYRLFDPEVDGLKKTDHAIEMYNNIIFHKQNQVLKQNREFKEISKETEVQTKSVTKVAVQTKVQTETETKSDLKTKRPKNLFTFKYVLFDAAYASKPFLATIDNSGNKYLCNLKSNRLCWENGVDYTNIDKKLNNKPVALRELDFGDDKNLKHQTGKIIRLKGFPTNKLTKLFKIIVSTDRTDYIVTNDLTINDQNVIKSVNGMRWNIESFHKELKQTTGIEACECRKARSQRTHINLALRAWIFIKQQAINLKTTVYQLKQNQLDDYYTQTMKNPKLRFEW